MNFGKINISRNLRYLGVFLAVLFVNYEVRAETMFDAGEEDIIESDKTPESQEVTAASLLGFEDTSKKPEKKTWGNLRETKNDEESIYINKNPETVPVMKVEITIYKSDPFNDRLKMVEDSLGSSSK